MTSSSESSILTITGITESAEPAASTASQAPMSSQEHSPNRPVAPAPASNHESRVPRRKTLSGPRSLNASNSPSAANSPLSSRDTSPARPPQRQQAASGPLPRSGLRSRKNSNDASPSRGPVSAGSSASVPSAAAIQRALNSATTPPLAPASTQERQEPSRVPRPLKSTSGTNSGDSTPHWPVSPRIKSPPPSADSTRSRSRRNSLRTQITKGGSSTPSITVQSSSPAPVSRIPVLHDEEEDDDTEELQQPMSMKPASRGVSGVAPKLETVQEASLPTTPGFEGLNVESIHSSLYSTKSSDDERNDVTSAKVTEDLSARANKHSESGGENNDSKGRMQDLRSSSVSRPSTLTPKTSVSSLSTIKSRNDAPSRNMTVETETVPSIPQATMSNQDRSASGRGDGSLRLKPSNETIRPKKEKTKPKRKAASINAGTGRSPRGPISYHHHQPSRPDNGLRSAAASSLGSPVSYRSYDDRRSMIESPPSLEMRRPTFQRSTSLLYSYSSTNVSARKASSKADVFEQKVAIAVDEANSSDSDATFIYESNPPDTQPHRSRQHHHSRTPSITSVVSIVDPRVAVRDSHNMGKKASMKFANPYNNQNADLGGLDHDGTVRIGSGRVSGGSHHHHIGRHGHGRGALNHILVDSDSSMAQSSRAVRGPSSRYASQPNSPRMMHNLNIANGNGMKKHGEYSLYDIDTENAADDERTPLMPTVRSPRVRTPRQRNSTTLRHQERRHNHASSWCRRVAGCLVVSIMVLVLIFSIAGLIFATTKPLASVKVHAIQNVIASQEELMLDLVVEAVNPNIIAINVVDMDMNIFAKSKHVGSDKWWREHGGKHRGEEDPEAWHLTLDDSAVSAEDASHTHGIDEGTDPIDDPNVGEPRTMLLGRIFHFDSPLNFDGSFFKRRTVQSLGEMRLSHPGNKTEAGGTERWEEVLQYPFDLIVKGVFKYQLPLSTQERKVPVSATYHYDPDAEKKKLKMTDVINNLQISGTTKRHLLPNSVKISSRPLGRYARPLANSES